jgi:hypothetical protein
MDAIMREFTEHELLNVVCWGFSGTKVFTYKLPSGVWTVATNSAMVVAIERRMQDIPLGYDDFPGFVGLKTLIEEPIIAETLKLEDFIGTLDVLPRTSKWSPCTRCNNTRLTTCDDCKGTGKIKVTCDCGHSHECSCETCDGSGKNDCKCVAESRFDRTGIFREMNLNIDRLIAGLRLFDDTEVRVSTGTRRKFGTLEVGYITVEGYGWRIILAEQVSRTTPKESDGTNAGT